MHQAQLSPAPEDEATPPLVSLRDVSKRFGQSLDLAGRIAYRLGVGHQARIVHALDGINLDILPGEVVGLVGESGSGKSTLGRIVAGLHAPSSGVVSWEGTDVRTLTGPARRAWTLAVQMIFQDPMSALNPRQRVGDIVTEAPIFHGLARRSARDDLAVRTLEQVGLPEAAMNRYPHQFSGGQRARIGIARALAVHPRFLVCDESVAALDVSIQAQVLNLFLELRKQLDLTILFISHDLGVVRHLSDRVVILYLGRIVESAPTARLYAVPNHPYTQALLANVPRLDARARSFQTIQGEIPSPLSPPSGCHFHPRCPLAGPRCRSERPALRRIGPDHSSACHLNNGGVA